MISQARKRYYAILVNIIIPLVGISTDIYLPSLPAIQHYFATTQHFAQWTVAAFVMAMGFSQLLAGPVSDAFGRKGQIVIALLLQILSIIGILLVNDIAWVILLRFTQGMGAGFMVVPARAVNNDLLTGDQLRKQFNYNTICFALGPVVGPYIGGYLQHFFGWQASFYFLLSYSSLLFLLLAFTFHETITEKKTFYPSHLWRNYHKIFQRRFFLDAALMVSLAYGFNALFYVVGPFLIQRTLGLSPVVYGNVALSLGVAWFLGNLLNRMVYSISLSVRIQLSIFCMALTAVAFFTLASLGYFNLWLIALPVFLLNFFGSVVFSVYVSECLSLFKELAASANACLFALSWFVFGSFTFIGSVLSFHTLLPLAACFCAVILMIFIHYYRRLRV